MALVSFLQGLKNDLAALAPNIFHYFARCRFSLEGMKGKNNNKNGERGKKIFGIKFKGAAKGEGGMKCETVFVIRLSYRRQRWIELEKIETILIEMYWNASNIRPRGPFRGVYFAREQLPLLITHLARPRYCLPIFCVKFFSNWRKGRSVKYY